MNTSEEGRLGEAKVLTALVVMGWYPFTDISGKCPVDILAWKDGRVISVQVKATRFQRNGKYVAQIGTTRSNKTINRVNKFDSSSCDYLAVYVSPIDEVHFLRASEITTTREVNVDNAVKIIEL